MTNKHSGQTQFGEKLYSSISIKNINYDNDIKLTPFAEEWYFFDVFRSLAFDGKCIALNTNVLTQIMVGCEPLTKKHATQLITEELIRFMR